MSPHLEEALRALRLADRDIHAFDVLCQDEDTHLSVICFHAQQAVEKSLKAVLFSKQIEFRRTHDLRELARLLRENEIQPPIDDDTLARLNPYAVTFRYDDVDIELVSREDAAAWISSVHTWADAQVVAATDAEIAVENESTNAADPG